VVPLDQLDLAKVARKAEVSWPTARRYLGNKQRLRRELLRAHPELADANTSRGLLLVAAAQVFAKRGFAAATLDEVGIKAGASKRAVYQHFTGKADLFLALLEARDATLARTAPDEIAGLFAALPPSQALARALEMQLARMRADQDYVRLYVEFLAASRGRAVRNRLRVSYQRQLDILVGVVAALKRSGVLVASTLVESVARVLLLLLDGLTLQSLVIELPDEKIGREVAGVLWQGLAPWVRTDPAAHQ
jgi:AcrR family transcriptional regulator